MCLEKSIKWPLIPRHLNRVLLLWILVFVEATHAACTIQAQCSSIFTAPVQSNTKEGTISTTGYAYFNPLNTKLPASTGNVSNIVGSISNTGGTRCTATGTPGGQLCVGDFLISSNAGGDQITSGIKVLTLGGVNNSITDYQDLKLSNSSVINFSTRPNGGTVYKIRSLSVNGSAVVNLQPGDYWVDNLTISGSAVLNTVGSGTVRIFVKNEIKLTGNSTVGSTVSNSPLLMYGYSNLRLGGSCIINGLVYLEGDFVASGNVVVNGAISANNIKGSGLTVNYNAGMINILETGTLCIASGTGLTGFTVSAPNTATSCGTTAVTVTALAGGATTYTGYTGKILLDTQKGVGSFSTNAKGVLSNNTGNGQAQYQFVTEDKGVVTFQLNYPVGGASPITIKAHDTSNMALFGLSNPLAFLPTGFVITGSQGSTVAYAGNSQAARNVTLYITAFSGTGCGIITGYSGIKTVKLWSTYVNPTTGTQAVIVNGFPIANSAAATPTTQSLTFTNGIATVVMNYADVGQLSMNALDMGAGAATGATGNFVVYPDHLTIQVLNNNAVLNTAKNDTTGTAVASCLADPIFTKAGQTFKVNIQPENANNAVTPNFGNEIIPQIITLTGPVIAPVSGAGSLNNITVSKITSANNPFFQATPDFSDVGCIHLTAAINNYLATGASVSNSVVVGRFVPDHFAVQTSANVTPVFNTQNGTFTYMDQPFDFATAPQLVIQAQNAQNRVTENYTGPFGKLFSTGLNYQYKLGVFASNGTDVLPNLSLIPSASRVITTSVPSVLTGTGTYVFTASDTNFGSGFKIPRTAGQLVPPFYAEIQLQVPLIQDADNVQCDASCNMNTGYAFGNVTLGNGIDFNGGKTFYLGRMVVQSVHGSELLNLAVPLQVEYYTASGFVLNTQDSTTSAASFVSPNNPPTCPASGTPNPLLCAMSGFSTTIASVAPTFIGGQALLTLTASNALGYVDITPQLQSSAANLPWLQYAWPSNSSNSTGAFTDNPIGRATFGIFKGNKNKTYQKEDFQ